MRHWDLDGDGKTFLLVFEDGDEIGAEIAAFATQQDIALAHFTGIGALSSVELLAFDVDSRSYRTSATLDEQCELSAIVGNLARHDGKPLVHAHLTVGRADGLSIAGHLAKAVVRPTCEIFLHVHPAVAAKHRDPHWGLPLYRDKATTA